ncbi:NADP-dependent oxidoreductase [Cupriavidus oxalaticus]|uniref:NADP-dependent oxidoreductase n=1 Tax=Cupriavidus oxalaticus TaxID=96344 RepID=A0A375GRG1_9BURK|nr:NADP-dependent oxidoreductase [Cupriavidus oxalaticus]QRQ85619.1 NADP-dependent oxidoreductase [Cupriavidus oxalaticus]QRQ90293.1 NADP-dependent oxidoreductase [Cupriavidus oxalaticus]WQD84804.1 NADP-dependent oxidoreductase [Cupriavidus oxalaticus]SPC07693.1 NADPH-dependent curcumin reductase [Cupriavidus oxalaticus]SPC24474.1 NADPH-dependent curcumin reductase [Cupriavidus oxalaticus]
MKTMNRRWILRQRPVGDIGDNDLQLVEAPLPRPRDGEILVRNIYLMVAPTNRVWMSDIDQYMAPVALGEVMRGVTMGVVMESHHPDFRPGDIVEGAMAWEEYSVTRTARRVPVEYGLPLHAYASVLGSSGMTAYFGMLDIARPKAGETIVVSAAAGGVGSIAGQIGKILGCRVVGVAGGQNKCRLVTEEFGLDACVDYKAGNVLADLRAACPDGIDVDFENVGGDTMDAVLALINPGARIALCGMISTYNASGDWWSPKMFRNVIMKRARIEGFLISDYRPRFHEAVEVMAKWVRDGQLKYRVDVIEGIEQAPAALNRLFAGKNIGKQLVRLAPESVIG